MIGPTLSFDVSREEFRRQCAELLRYGGGATGARPSLASGEVPRAAPSIYLRVCGFRERLRAYASGRDGP